MRSSALFPTTAFALALVAVACGNKASDGDAGGSGAAPAAGSAGTTAGNAGTETMSSGGSAGTASTQGGSSNGGASSGGTSSGGASSGGAGATMGSGGSAGTVASSGNGGSGTGGAGSGAAGTSSTSGGSAGTAAGGDGAGATSGMPGTGGSSMAGSGGGLTNPKPSNGCSSTPKAAPASGMGTIDVGGTMRQYIVRIPDGYDGTSPMRIIFAFHGAQGSAVQVDNGDPPNQGLDPTGPYYGIKEHADDHTIFVAGQANGTWGTSDIDYVKALVSKFEDELCLDESRILATGFSMGGIMTVRVACNMYDVFRAVAPMSCSLSAASCPKTGGRIAYWSSHGEQDTTIDISNGEAARDEFAKRNGCDTTTMPIGSDGCVAYEGCDDGYPVNWCPFMGIHQPPPFSGPEIWAFLSQF